MNEPLHNLNNLGTLRLRAQLGNMSAMPGIDDFQNHSSSEGRDPLCLPIGVRSMAVPEGLVLGIQMPETEIHPVALRGRLSGAL